MDYYQCINEYQPITEEQTAIQKAMLTFIDVHKVDVLTRVNKIAHMTASSVIVNEEMTKMLMIHHKIYDTWTWQGGHADGEADMLKIALKEAEEETGLIDLSVVHHLDEPVMRLDILPVNAHIKKGEYISTHLHLNVAYVFIGKETDQLLVNEDETNGLKWVPLDKIDDFAKEPEITPIYHKLIQRAITSQL